MIKRNLVALLAVLATTLPGNGEVIYVRGPLPPPAPFPVIFGAGQSLDFDSNGVPEIVFSFGGGICTDDYPSSFCSFSFYVGATDTSELLLSGFYSAALSRGESIAAVAPDATTWSPLGYNAYLTTQWWSLYGREIDGQLVHSGWTGPLSTQSEGFLGVRFYSADGWLYGWIRVRLDVPGWVVDYAYESQPDTAILAGAGIDDDNDGVWDLFDQCSDTPAGEAVDAQGCSISQLVPCDGPWKNHGEYVARIIATVTQFLRQHLITPAEARAVVREAARSDCGSQRPFKLRKGRLDREREHQAGDQRRVSQSR